MQRMSLLLLALVLAAGVAQAQEKFQRKSGLWEVKRTATRTEDQVRSYQMCIDQASDNALRQLVGGMRSETCQTSKAAHEGDKLVVDATCKVQKTTATTHAVITGKFDTAYKLESKSTFDPPLRGQSEGTTVLEAKWTGACKPDQKPGDIILPSGGKINVATGDKASDKAAAKKAAREKSQKKRGGYAPPPAAPGSPPTPAAPLPGTTTK
jgi:hypothetical protein